MTNATLFDLLGMDKERAFKVAKKVRASFHESETPGDWIASLTEEFGIDEENAEVFACGWFAGKYAGVSEVFNTVQKEMDLMEKDRAEKKEMESRTLGLDGYV
jgi:hypothetical protein